MANYCIGGILEISTMNITLQIMTQPFQDPQQCYTYQGGSWSATARMLQDRQQGAGVAQLADGRAFVFGGHDGKPVDT